MSTPFSRRRGLSYMKRNASNSAGTNSTVDATIAAPWLTAVSLYIRWLNVESTRGTFDWGNTAASALEAKTNNRWLILRISCGNDAPAHVYSDFGGPNGGVPKVTLNAGAYIQPAVWTQAYRNEYVRLYTAVNALLATPLTDASGETVGDYCLGVTVGSASQDNPEMASTTQYKVAGNSAAIKAALDGTTAAKDGLTGKGDQGAYDLRLIELLSDQWQWGIQWHMANVTKCPSVFALGTLGVRNDADTGNTTDNGDTEHFISSTFFGGVNAGKLIGLITNYGINQTSPGSGIAVLGAPYQQNKVSDENISVANVRAAGGVYAFQYDSASLNGMTAPNPATSLALSLTMGATLSDSKFYVGNITSFYRDVQFIECGTGLFGVNDIALQNANTTLKANLIGGVSVPDQRRTNFNSGSVLKGHTDSSGSVVTTGLAHEQVTELLREADAAGCRISVPAASAVTFDRWVIAPVAAPTQTVIIQCVAPGHDGTASVAIQDNTVDNLAVTITGKVMVIKLANATDGNNTITQIVKTIASANPSTGPVFSVALVGTGSTQMVHGGTNTVVATVAGGTPAGALVSTVAGGSLLTVTPS